MNMEKRFKFKSMSVYSSDEWMANSTKRYRTVFDKAETDYIRCELALYNKLFDEEDWQTKIILRCEKIIPGNNEKICELETELKVSKDENIAFFRDGWRHCRGRQELRQRIKDGQIGDIVAIRAYRMGNGGGATGQNNGRTSELLYQVRRFHSFLWASGGVYSDYYIHQIDECSWMKDAWPVRAQALGARQYRGSNVDQNMDVYGVEYVFADGVRFFFDGRNMPGCHNEFASYVHGAKGSAIVSTSGHAPGKVRIFNGQDTEGKPVWAYPQPEASPYQLEWDDLISAIREDKPYNEVERGAIASMVSSMGRMAAHTGQIVTFDEMMNCEHEFAPDVDKLTMTSEAPLKANADGKYPLPEPGIKRKREY